MNKKILAVAVAAIMASGPILATADNTLSGYYLYRLESIDSDVRTDNYGEITLNGSEEISAGLTGVYQMNFELVSDNGVNVAGQNFLGLAGGFGTVVMGKLDHPYRSAGNNFRGGVFGDSVAGSMQSLQRVNSNGALAYVSPNFSGVTVSGAVVPMTVDGDSKLPFSLSAVYNQGPFLATIAYEDLSEAGAPTAFLIGARYSASGLMAGLMYEMVEDETGGANDGREQNRILVPVQYQVTPQVAVRGAVMYTENEPAVGAKTDWTEFAIGAQYNFSSRTLARLNVRSNDNDSDDTNVGLTVIHNF